MKAIVSRRYGPPLEVMDQRDVPLPRVRDDEVLVRMRASSINSSDWEFLVGSPAYVRAMGLLRPPKPILGSDVSGQVEAVGKGVRSFREGDSVFGDILYRWGAFAEFVCVSADALTLKPQGLSFEDAATLPQAASVALQAVRHKANIKAGEQVLITGAGGGTGTFAVQLAKWLGAEVTGVDRASKQDVMKAAGADHTIDFRETTFTDRPERYDAIVAFVAAHSVRSYRRCLRPGGRYVMVGGSVPRLIDAAVMGSLLSLTDQRRLGILGAKLNVGLDEIVELIEAGIVRTFIEQSYPLEELPAAMQRFGQGEVRGKLVITYSRDGTQPPP